MTEPQHPSQETLHAIDALMGSKEYIVGVGAIEGLDQPVTIVAIEDVTEAGEEVMSPVAVLIDSEEFFNTIRKPEHQFRVGVRESSDTS